MGEAKKPGCGISSRRHSRPTSCIFLVTCHKKEAEKGEARHAKPWYRKALKVASSCYAFPSQTLTSKPCPPPLSCPPLFNLHPSRASQMPHSGIAAAGTAGTKWAQTRLSKCDEGVADDAATATHLSSNMNCRRRCVCIHVYTCVCVFVHVYTCVCVCVYTHVYTCVCVCVCPA